MGEMRPGRVRNQYFPVMSPRSVNVRFRKRRTFASGPDYDRNAATSDIKAHSDSSGLTPLPSAAFVTKGRCLLCGANTPWNHVRLNPGLCANTANRAMK